MRRPISVIVVAGVAALLAVGAALAGGRTITISASALAGATVSRVIRIGAHLELSLAPTATEVGVLVRAHSFFDRVRVLLQRGDGEQWLTVASARLHRLGTATEFQQSEATLRRRSKHGIYRVFLPTASAAPCCIATATPSLRL